MLLASQNTISVLLNEFTSINEVYGAWVKDMQVKPARAAFAAAALPAGALVEIVVQAMR
jgi:enamine deaminase RidA (YjgF/YER057c/UK114 family)